MKNILITGANGFIGYNLCKTFINEDVTIFALIRKNTNKILELNKYSNFHAITCDMADYINLPKILKNNNVDIIYHFAWEGSAGPLRGDAYKQIDNI